MAKKTATGLRAEYLKAYPQCQYTEALMGNLRLDSHFHTRMELEHIWGRNGAGVEHWSNYATVSPGVHLTKHSHPTVCRIAISLRKFELAEQTGDRRHFDLEAIRVASGIYLPGWLEWKLSEGVPEWAERMGRELLERIDSAASRSA